MRHILTTICLRSETGHVMGRVDGKCVACGEFIPSAPAFTLEERQKLRAMRRTWRGRSECE